VGFILLIDFYMLYYMKSILLIICVQLVTGQFANKLTRGRSTRGLVNSPKRLI